jgi:hypothetical protein
MTDAGDMNDFISEMAGPDSCPQYAYEIHQKIGVAE